MSKNNGIFQRTEKKYQLNKEQCRAFLEQVEDLIQADEFGMHTISNIYYDTDDYGLIRHSIEGSGYKEKFRIRGYGEIESNSVIYLELKKKVRGVVHKRRAALPYKQAKRYLRNGVFPDGDNQILKEIQYFLGYYKAVPKLYLAYDRTAYEGIEDSSLRITIDQNIRSRNYDLDLSCGDKGTALDSPSYLMEIKVQKAYPLWLSRLLSELEIYPASFSKYGTIYKEFIVNDRLGQTEEREENLCLQAYLIV